MTLHDRRDCFPTQVAAFGSLATTLSLQAPLSHHGGQAYYADDHADDHHRRRRLSGGAQLAHLSFSQSVFLYCLMTATVVSVRRFTDGHRAQWRRNDLFGTAPRGYSVGDESRRRQDVQEHARSKETEGT